MLLKWLCMKCYDEHRAYPWSHSKNVKKKEHSWANGRMYCVAFLDIEHKMRCVKTAGDPPDCCYYLLEQTLNQPSA